MRRDKLVQSPRRGAVLVLAALLLVILFGMVAFSIDIGYVALTRTQLQRAADGAAHAAALNINLPAVRTQIAIDTAAMMTAGGKPVVLSSGDIQYGLRHHRPQRWFCVQLGQSDHQLCEGYGQPDHRL